MTLAVIIPCLLVIHKLCVVTTMPQTRARLLGNDIWYIDTDKAEHKSQNTPFGQGRNKQRLPMENNGCLRVATVKPASESVQSLDLVGWRGIISSRLKTLSFFTAFF